MNGFKRLSSDIRKELLEDANDVERGAAFRGARKKSEQCDLDEYIKFISECMEDVAPEPSTRLTHDFRL